jgi:hypothetical protein
MKRLHLLGYAPADKEAWPHGGLSEKLEALDLRHGVTPNLVMTPILSAACHLEASHQPAFLDYVRTHILEGDENKRHRRYNVLTRNVDKAKSDIDEQVEKLFDWDSKREKAAADASGSLFDPAKELCLVFSYWAVSALFSYLIERERRWTKKDLKTFGHSFLTEAIRQTLPDLAVQLGLPKKLPKRDIPRLGLYFRICTQGKEADVRRVLEACVRELRDCSQKSETSDAEVSWIVSVIRSLVPLPHNEVYQGYKKDTNPIGKYQACFASCQDPKDLKVQPDSQLMWRYVGEAIAKKLLE